MTAKKGFKTAGFFNDLSKVVIKFTGSSVAFFGAFGIIIVWAALGPVFKFSDTWQLVINTSTTIVTFLMVFIIQQSQNKDTMALHLKLNELIASTKGASNTLVSAEDLTEHELEVLKKFYTKLATLSHQGESLGKSHSIDEARNIHESKQSPHKAITKK